MQSQVRASQKGKIEKFHQKVGQFTAEIRVAHVNSVEELNRRWRFFLEQEYQEEAYAGIKEYYDIYVIGHNMKAKCISTCN